MPLATDFVTSNFLNADSLEQNVSIEATIVSARPHKFESGDTKLVVYVDYLGKGVVLNQTRLKTLMREFGVNYDLWADHKVIISRGLTMYQGRKAPCVVVEPVVTTRIAVEPRPALEASSPKPIQTTRGSITPGSVDIRSDRNARSDPAPSPPPPDACPDGPADPSDDIPF
jgi:hypothetical protein